MRFSAVHKTSSYLMAGSAFLALALSDELPVPAIVLGGAGILASWFWEPPRVRPERWSTLWNIAAVLAFGLTIAFALTSGEWVISGADFLVFLLCAKLFNRRSSRDYQWIYVLTFLMLVAGTTLNADLSYAVCFLGYVVSATWALILFHLRREMEENFLLKHSDDASSERVEVERILSSRRIVGGKFLLATSSASLAIFFLSALLFLIFPRVGFGLFFQRSQSRLTFAGFSDAVTLGGHGLIRSDPTVVMRVKITDPRYEGAAAPELHWRGVAFDRYSQGRWSRSSRAFGTRAKTSAAAGVTRVVLDAGRQLGLDGALRQEIYLEPLDTSTLFAASAPLAFDLDNVNPAAAGGFGRFTQNDEVRYPHLSGLRYVAYSNPASPTPEALAGAREADPRIYAAYLQIPPEMPARVADLARRITAGKVGPYAKAEAVIAYLHREYRYTLVMDSDDRREPLDYFLFDRKQGHCEYFSTAMAILLRAVGVPTRNVDGFVGGEWNEYGKYVAVRGGDAHSWVEVWFEGVGWVTYDPTPPSPDLPLRRGGGGALDRLRRMLDTLRLSWFKWVIEYDLGRQLGLMRSVGGILSFGGTGGIKSISAWANLHRGELYGSVAGLGAGATAVLLLRRRRRRDGYGDRSRKPDHPIVVEYTRAARALAGHGFPRAPSQTPREHASALVAGGSPGAAPYASLTELYYRARYAGDEVDVAEARALSQSVRSELKQAR